MNNPEPPINPSCGMVSLARVNGQVSLFGSPFKHDEHYVELKITGGRIYRSSFRDQYSQDIRRPIAKVWLSSSQFAELITNMNKGDGVPCTIKTVGRERMPEPTPSVEALAFAHEHQEALAASIKHLQESLEQVKQLKVSAADKTATLKSINRALDCLGDTVPFIQTVFTEFMADAVSAAKQEIADYCLQMDLDSAKFKPAVIEPSVVNNNSAVETQECL